MRAYLGVFTLFTCLFASSAACDSSETGSGGTGGEGANGGQGGEGGTPAADPTSFRATGTMPVAVRYHQATLLGDGRVLISGGAARIDSVPLDQAAAFDPASEKFTALDAMGTPRAFHTATLLADGKVLLAGGGQANIIGLASGLETTKTAELFDPATNTFTPTGDMQVARAGHQALRLEDGRVLVVGGGTDEEGTLCNAMYPDCVIAKVTATAEIYDPAKGTFSAIASMASPRISFTLTALPDGRALALAGANDSDTQATSEIFDPSSMAWSAGPSLARDRLYHSTVLLGDGRTLMIAGKDGNVGPLKDAALLDAGATAWSEAKPYGETLTAVAATRLASGNAIFIGGYNQYEQDNSGSVRIFDQKTNAFVKLPDLPKHRGLATATLLADGRVLACGGISGAVTTSKSCDISETAGE